jgi:cell division protease FtsH
VDPEVTEFARSFTRFTEAMNRAVGEAVRSPVRDLLEEFLGEEPSMLPVIAESHPAYDHANVQIALTAYLDQVDRSHRLIGLSGQQRRWMSLSDLVASAHHAGVGIGSVDLVNLPIGPDDTLACVAFGLYLIEDRGAKMGLLLRSGNEERGTTDIGIEIACRDRDAALALLAELRRLMVELNVFRGKMVSFGESRMGHVMAGPIVFHRRPDLSRDAIVLPPGLLEQVERQVFGIAEQRERLRSAGQHVKRGLLLHGPPGTGKTLTVRYVAGRARDHTVVVLTGGGLGMVRAACGLARMLQPSIVVLEDVDLVAQHRVFNEMGNPLLFDVLNEMDGIAEDADVAFLLTSNRADLLEAALAARPGRVDLAVEIPLPDDDARTRLFDLYSAGLDVRISDLERVIVRTSGVTASFIKELVRKAALVAALADGEGTRLTITDEHVRSALDELLDERSNLTRSLLGGAAERPGTDWLRPQAEE